MRTQRGSASAGGPTLTSTRRASTNAPATNGTCHRRQVPTARATAAPSAEQEGSQARRFVEGLGQARQQSQRHAGQQRPDRSRTVRIAHGPQTGGQEERGERQRVRLDDLDVARGQTQDVGDAEQGRTRPPVPPPSGRRQPEHHDSGTGDRPQERSEAERRLDAADDDPCGARASLRQPRRTDCARSSRTANSATASPTTAATTRASAVHRSSPSTSSSAGATVPRPQAVAAKAAAHRRKTSAVLTAHRGQERLRRPAR